ncbi:DNA helicase [Ferrimonas sediminicola]|uniref:DNA 3'-5' helicase n=2 Tax=Ferrimonas sediminicola TaxID=2569538 RepID=A0A4U1BDG8_9GAMM|nr:DNA helicase [Ferrimonas sediminicola]
MTATPTIGMSSEFLTCFSKLPKTQQKKVEQFVAKFRDNPESSGINFERIQQARDKRMVSVRIDKTYRGIVLKPDVGNVYLILWVDHHDKAYDWAAKHRVEIHPATGSIQLFNAEYSEQEATPVPSSVNTSEIPLFAAYKPEQLIALGVPESLLSAVTKVTNESELEALDRVLPAEAYEPLFLLAAGEPYEELLAEYNPAANETIDTEDFVGAITRAASQRNFHVVTDDLELQKMLNAPLEKWRIFLHPSQRRLVEGHAKGPQRVLGGAGTGKTVVAMHRARWLAQQLDPASNDKVLFTTFTKNLALDIEANLKKLCSKEELARIEVINIDAWIARLLKRYDYQLQVVYENDDHRRDCWDKAMALRPEELSFPDSFYEEEWRLVVQAQQLRDRPDYLKASRVGRGTRLSRVERAKVWPVFEQYRNLMAMAQLRDFQDAMHDGIKLFQKGPLTLPYKHAVVDEGQDIGSAAFQLLRTVIPEGANDLFIVGDGHQRIYRHKVVLGRCGINIRGRRSKKLKINYRTTEETKRFAMAVLQGVKVDDLDGKTDSNQDYLSLAHGEQPQVHTFSDFKTELDAIVEHIRALTNDGVAEHAICVVLRTNNKCDKYQGGLEARGISVVQLQSNRSDTSLEQSIRIATMHRVKGLEFQYLVIADASAGTVPLDFIRSNDPVEQREQDLNERALFHVAATRAMKGLMVTSVGKPSRFLLNEK